MQTTISHYPKIGKSRELKNIIESYWKGNLSKEDMMDGIRQIKQKRAKNIINAKIDIVPCNDFSLYDFVLDTSVMFGVIPERFKNIDDFLGRYFAMARGLDNAVACEMTKWFDTNYHYIVPEINGRFRLTYNWPLESYRWFRENFHHNPKIIVLGVVTYIFLGKTYDNKTKSFIRTSGSKYFKNFILDLAKEYNKMLRECEKEGVTLIQFDEPALVLDLDDDIVDIILMAYNIITEGISNTEIFISTYYESIDKFEKLVYRLPVHGIGLDFTVNDENLDNLKLYGFPKDKKLIAGIVSGRNPWTVDFKKTMRTIEEIQKIVLEDNILLSNSSPLFHLPISTKFEKGHLPKDTLKLLSFADERMDEIRLIKDVAEKKLSVPRQNIYELRRKFQKEQIRQAVKNMENKNINKRYSFKDRYKKQIEQLNLPMFPTTTIGSFPQTGEVRKIRAKFKNGELTEIEYKNFIEEQIKNTIDIQNNIGLDVFVHGEFERTDMVEFFGEKMEGFATTKNGWVQSYGTRCIRPPIIYGDISRPTPMTLDEILYAQSLTNKPVKAILTGPVTILNWSFYRNDIPKKEIAYQIALSLSEEVTDLEKNGIKIIQIDEPAFREGLPLKHRKQGEYLEWAVKAFKITNYHVKEETQIHTHMCYSEFNEIIEYIYQMDSDVISIEASRSKGDILEAFERFKYDHGIGLGVYDIHSPRIPSVGEMKDIVGRSLIVLDPGLMWINPDCGLKTRKWEEVIPALKNMVEVAKTFRKKYNRDLNNTKNK